ncbi:MAG: hypothetical protein MK086_02350 [Flavobacteriales bacterium]|nr:hypothetical protein [Flavobacteriales bacterium]
MNLAIPNPNGKSTFVALINLYMLKLNFKHFLFAAAAIILISSCETEVDLLAPYEETPVIYGILDFSKDTQFVRINKTFLGEGDPSLYAGIKDSIEYDPEDISAIIFKYDTDGNLLDSFPLLPTDIPNREPGIFYDEDVRFYYTDAQLFTASEIELNSFNPSDFSFKLNVNIKGEEYTATTVFPGITESTIFRPIPPSGIPPTVAELRFTFGSSPSLNFTSTTLTFVRDGSTEVYSGLLRLNFNYEDVDGNYFENQKIDFSLGEFTPSQNQFTSQVQGENYYTFLASQFDQIPGLSRVEFVNLKVIVTGAPEELSTYIDVVQPVSEFSPTLSNYTNIDNGAIGIFSSVGSVSRLAFFSENSVKMFRQFSLTNTYNYCVLEDGDNDGLIWSTSSPCQ